ncbi:MAG: C40 family peptidase [Bacteroidota bacterium]
MNKRCVLFALALVCATGVNAQKQKVQRLETLYEEGRYERVLSRGADFLSTYPREPQIHAWMARANGALAERASSRARERNFQASLVNWQRAYRYGGEETVNENLQFTLWMQYNLREEALMAYYAEKKHNARYYTQYLAEHFGDTLYIATPLLGWQPTSPLTFIAEAALQPVDPINRPDWAKDPQNPVTLPQYIISRDSLVAEAKRHLGTRYQWGGTAPNTGFDCSGFVLHTFRSQGYDFLHGTAYVKELGWEKNFVQAEDGDLVFFGEPNTHMNATVSHMGILLTDEEGERLVIHSTSRGVTIDPLGEDDYWTDRILFFRDVIDLNRTEALEVMTRTVE